MKGKILFFIFILPYFGFSQSDTLLKDNTTTGEKISEERIDLPPFKPLSFTDMMSVGPRLSVSGFVDAYYSYDLAEPRDNEKPDFFYNHNRHNEFSINMALIDLQYSSTKTRGAIGLMVGTYPQYNLAHEQDLMRNIYEAYGGVELIDCLWLDAGVFGSHLGFESAISSENITLTRSLMAESSPYYLSGAKLTYTGIEKWTFQAIVSNGWQNISESFFNDNKAIGTQIIFEPNEKILFNYSTMFSDEGVKGFPATRFFNDVYAIISPTEKLKVIAAFDYGMQEDFINNDWSTWYAPAVLVGYDWQEKFSTGLRTEYYVDKEGVIIQPDFAVFGTSLNLDYKPSKNAVLRLEGKWLYSEEKIFERSNYSFHSDNVAITTSLAVRFGD